MRNVPDNVLMLKEFHDVHLSLDHSEGVLIQLGLVDDLYCHLVRD